MKIVAACCLLLMAALAQAQELSIPRSWWKEEMSVQQIETADHVWRSELIAHLTAIPPENLQATGAHGSLSTTEKQATIATLVGDLSRLTLASRPEWIRIKSRIRPGDRIYNYAAPPLSGPIGYILVRNDAIIDEISIADQ